MNGPRLAACILALALGGCSPEQSVLNDALPYYATADLTPLWAPEMTPAQARVRVGAFELTDQKGRRVTNRTLVGAPYVVSFLFTSCNGICPPIVHNLREIQEGTDATIVSFSVTPDADTVPVLERFGAERGIDPERWRLLTGDARAIHELARSSFFADGGTEDGTFVHEESVFLVDGDGRIRGVYNGMVALDIDRLAEDLDALAGAD